MAVDAALQCVEVNTCHRETTTMAILNNVALRVRWAIFALAAHFIDPLPPPEMNFILPAIESHRCRVMGDRRAYPWPQGRRRKGFLRHQRNPLQVTH